MSRRIRLGILTPSSNTSLEPLTQALIAGLPEVSVHFARFSVTQIALSPDALGQFVWDMLRRCGVDTRRIAGWGRLVQEF
jgi:hypothetical protein